MYSWLKFLRKLLCNMLIQPHFDYSFTPYLLLNKSLENKLEPWQNKYTLFCLKICPRCLLFSEKNSFKLFTEWKSVSLFVFNSFFPILSFDSPPPPFLEALSLYLADLDDPTKNWLKAEKCVYRHQCYRFDSLLHLLTGLASLLLLFPKRIQALIFFTLLVILEKS